MRTFAKYRSPFLSAALAATACIACGNNNGSPTPDSGDNGGGGSSGGSGGSSGGGASGGGSSGSGSNGGGSNGASSSGSSGGSGSGSSGGSSSGGADAGSSGAPSDSGSGGSSGAGIDATAPLVCPAPPPTSTAYAVDANGVTFTVGTGRVRLQVCANDIIRVQYTTASTLPAKTSLSVNNTWATPTPFCVAEAAGTVTITTARMKANVATATGLITYSDLADKVVLAEATKTVTAATVQGISTNTVQTSFASPANEALFGLGQHQDGVINRKGSSVHMVNANTEIQIPLVVSNNGYGVLWDNYSTTDFAGNQMANTRYGFSSAAGDMVDYYFFYGPSIDHVIALYRTATGAAPLFPKWSYGLFQSKDRYGSAADLTAVETGYRSNNIPLDAIVQDWHYWDPYVQGSHIMDASRYPDPVGLVAQLHKDNLHGMISIWPVYETRANGTAMTPGELDNFNALNMLGALLPSTSNGTTRFYDVFNSDARTLVYKQIHDGLHSNDGLLGSYGWDGIWADNDEPQDYPPGSVNVSTSTIKLAPGKGAFYINAYPLEHTQALYEGWRMTGPSKRVYVLSRSAYAGQQRYGAGCWSGDINASATVFANQIPAGLSFAISGMPYWTTDIGGYTGTPSEELFTRWFQFGAFCTTFRIHGQAPKELYGAQWSATGKANLLAVDNLRYRLMPYIYSLAWKVTSEGYTIQRPLVFDFQNDAMVYGIKDQFMFGPAFLANPVTTMGATTRSVYLPAGTWYDFWTGATTMGGMMMSTSAPLAQMPLFVRAGSIVPMGPMIQYATQSADPLEIRIYKGQDGSFVLYEDEGDTYNYETGKYATIPFTWNDAAKQLTIGARAGSFTGMLMTRTFNIVFVGASQGAGTAVTATPDQVVKYDGSATMVMGK